MSTTQVDESLYSRQLYVLGRDGMHSLTQAVILCSGMTGLGLEITKNIVLAGVKKVIIHDIDNTVLPEDIGYCFSESTIGLPKLPILKKYLQELNGNVIVDAFSDPLYEEFIKQFTVVIVCDDSPYNLTIINDVCRANGIKFIMANNIGLYGYIFCDFGDNFVTNNPTGEEPKTGIIVGTEQINDQQWLLSEEPHDLETGMIITIAASTHTVVKIKDKNRFMCDPVVAQTSGSFTQIIQPQTIKFTSLRNSFANPQFLSTDLEHPERDLQLHMFTRLFWARHSYDTINTLMKIVNADHRLIDTLYNSTGGRLGPVDSVLGGIAAQEVLKACMQKTTPICGWMYYNVLSLVRDIPAPVETNNGCLTYTERIFGKAGLDAIRKSRIFIVGAGAIGCEHLKNLVMMGIGNIVVTDMDHIEKSNLNRQFLFRSHDIGRPKSIVLMEAAKKMDPHVNIVAHTNRVDETTTNIYNPKFFSEITCVTNALDNVEARLFVDSLCVSNTIPLLESGTLGTKGNVQCIIPHLTESYGSTQDPPEKTVPMCTLKNFPYLYEHVVQYSRDMLEGLFRTAPLNYIRSTGDLNQIPSSELGPILTDVTFMVENKPKNFDDCIRFAFKLWHNTFKYSIEALIAKFPKDHLNDDGSIFWTGVKKFPRVLEFDAADQLDYIVATSNIWGDVFGIKKRYKKSSSYIKLLAGCVPTPPKSSELDTTDPISDLKKLMLKQFEVHPIEFDKDNDSNHHVDFIHASAFNRAQNYSIDTVDKLKTKQIAGKIIPAIATTTALVSGLVGVELFKVIMGIKDIDRYKNSFANLSIPFLASSSPVAAPATLINRPSGIEKYTLWSYDTFEKDKTLSELLTLYNSYTLAKDGSKLSVEFVSAGSKMIYNSIIDSDDNLNRPIKELMNGSDTLIIGFDLDIDPLVCRIV